jgi:hypothetical protein
LALPAAFPPLLQLLLVIVPCISRVRAQSRSFGRPEAVTMLSYQSARSSAHKHEIMKMSTSITSTRWLW